MVEPNDDEIKDKADGDEVMQYRTVVDRKTDPETQTKLAKFQLIYSIFALGLGLVCIVAGVVLFLNGVSGAASWTASMLGSESKITNAAPGVILFIVGLFIVYLTRYRFAHK